MVKRKKDITGITQDLFQQLETPALETENAPPLSLTDELRGAMAQAMREARQHYGYGRFQIVERMNFCLDEDDEITIRKLNAWMAASKEDHNFPAAWLPAFCWATGTIAPFQVMLHAIDYEAVDIRDRYALRLGQVQIEKSQLGREERSLKNKLGQ